jgi:LCP family protein required for cell wall assembly
MTRRQQLYNRLKRQMLQHVLTTRIIIGIVALAIVIGIGSLIAKPTLALLQNIFRGPKFVTTFFTNPLYILPSYEGRTNILIIGMGGEEHSGGELTDTIIFTALDLQNTEVTMLSIPRDIWVPSLETKINAAYAIGVQDSTRSGYLVLEDAVYEITNQPTHYVVGINFEGFKEIIDIIGGIDVQVERSFTDAQYPVRGRENDDCAGDPDYKCRYETIHFAVGTQHMDGETALKFSRSRHAPGDEGTDFARSQRQQKVIAAIKNKLASTQILLNPQKLIELKSVADRYIIFDEPLTDDEYAAFASFGVSYWRNDKEVKSMTLDTGTEEIPGFLVNPPIAKYNSWVLEPRGESWAEFQSYFSQQLKRTQRH